jgi:hypothetical protein
MDSDLRTQFELSRHFDQSATEIHHNGVTLASSRGSKYLDKYLNWPPEPIGAFGAISGVPGIDKQTHNDRQECRNKNGTNDVERP